MLACVRQLEMSEKKPERGDTSTGWGLRRRQACWAPPGRPSEGRRSVSRPPATPQAPLKPRLGSTPLHRVGGRESCSAPTLRKHVARPVLDRRGGIANGSREPRRGPGHVESRTVPINGSAGALRVRRPARRTTKWPAGARGSIRVARQRLGARTARPAGAQAASGLISPPQAVHLDRADSRPRAQKLQFNRTRAPLAEK